MWSYYAAKDLRIRSNAEIACHEQTVIARVAGDIQSSSRRNSGSSRLVLKPLTHHAATSRSRVAKCMQHVAPNSVTIIWLGL